MYFNSIVINHKTTYDDVMKKTPLSPCPFFERSGGQCHLVTVISSHCLAASTAEMSAFNSRMRQTA